MVSLWLEQARQGRRRAIARLITQVENSPAAAEEVVMALYQDTGRAHTIGITGPPGSGKSTLVNELAKSLRQRGLTVGIVAVDPSSPFTGGALLGDRVRMRDLAGDEGIFIRSMASRGSLGGLAQATSAVVKVLDAAGFEIILIETVGAGQAEVDIASLAHTTLVIEAPGMGDEIQSIKAGILEIADILVVNKADRPGAANTTKALKMMLHFTDGISLRHHGQQMEVARVGAEAPAGKWQINVYETVAAESKGISDVTEAILAHKAHLQASGEWVEREKKRSREEINDLLQYQFMIRLQAAVPAEIREQLIEAVAKRQLDPYSAVGRLFGQIHF